MASKRPPLDNLRIGEVSRLLRARRAAGAVPPDLEEAFLRAILPHLLGLPAPVRGKSRPLSWVELHAPEILVRRGEEWVAGLEARPPHRLSAVALGKALRLGAAERKRLRITTFRPIDKTKAELLEDQRVAARLRMKRLRAAKGATPRDQSLSAVRPWEAAGVSRRTWERRRLRGEGVPAPLSQTRSEQDLRSLGDANEFASITPIPTSGEPLRGSPAPLAATVIRVRAPLGSVSRAALAAVASRRARVSLEVAA